MLEVNIDEVLNLSNVELSTLLFNKGYENIKKDPSLKTELAIKDYIEAIFPTFRSLFGGEISKEQERKRLYVCSKCELLSIIDNQPACGVCGCVLKPENHSVINLVIRPETPEYGCKHPSGSRWKVSGC